MSFEDVRRQWLRKSIRELVRTRCEAKVHFPQANVMPEERRFHLVVLGLLRLTLARRTLDRGLVIVVERGTTWLPVFKFP